MAPRLLTPLILCGGGGTRLWPVSRDDRPKQFIKLFGDLTSFQETVLRVRDPELFAAPVIVTNERYGDLVAAQLAEIGADASATILVEPSRRESGPAIAAAAAYVAQRDPEAPLIVLPSDHVVRDTAAFRAAAATAREGAQAGYIVTFGIEPDYPAVAYGYVRPGGAEVCPGLREVARFVEKPDLGTARRYISEGYLWNSGKFVFRADVLLAEYGVHDPDTLAAARAAAERATPAGVGLLLDAEAFAGCRTLSIDYAVIERSKRVAVVPVTMGWSDVGSWHAVWQLSDKDPSGNVAQGEALFRDAKDNLVRTDDRLVCLIGLEGVGVIATGDAILVFDRREDGSLKEVVAELKRTGHPSTGISATSPPASDRRE